MFESPNQSEFLNATRRSQALIDEFLQQTHHQVTSQLDHRKPANTQFIRHGMAWQATLAEAMKATSAWAAHLQDNNKLTSLESNIAQAAVAELLGQLLHGIAMSQDEVFRPDHVGLSRQAYKISEQPDIKLLLSNNCHTLGQTITNEARRCGSIGNCGLDESLQQIRGQLRNFSNSKIMPLANRWHLDNALIPDQLISELGELGVFGLTIPDQYHGSGLGKLAMCVVTEELSRGYIGAGSLGTRSEIAAELIQLAGTDAQKERYLPGIASGAILPAAVFTEPDTGSDLASINTRATRLPTGEWSISGNKTWITHASRADLMTLLARTNQQQTGHTGLTMFLIDKSRGNAVDNFPDKGLSGNEIEVLGYRGMKEYDLAFDRFLLPPQAALGDSQGQGFKQLMTTFEAARIQTAARAVGVAENAYELATDYATNRLQFRQPIIQFQRIYGKIARMIVDITVARQLTYCAARKKDRHQRCDIEAGMAKLYAARTAWSCADNAVQVHGGTGYALDSPVSRILNDSRILNIFEGTAEIQADIIARRLLS